MPRLMDLGLFAWLALIALLASFNAVGGEFLIGGEWELPVYILLILSLPITVWACLSRPVRGRPLLAFALGLLNYLLIPVSSRVFRWIVWGSLHGWKIPPSPLTPAERLLALLRVASTTETVLYALGAALVAGSGETDGERTVLGLLLIIASWVSTCVSLHIW